MLKKATVAAMITATLASASVLAASTENTGVVRQPNILFLVAEDLSPRIGAFGDAIGAKVTPNIDRLAAKSVKYTNVFTTSGVCAPSRAALITGVHQNAIGAGGMRTSDFEQADYLTVPPEYIKAFPELLRKAGYWTYENNKLDYQFSGPLPEQGPFTIWDAEAGSTQGVYWKDRPDGKPFFGMYAFLETHESGLFPRFDVTRGIFPAIMGVMQYFKHRGVEPVVTPEEVIVPPYYPDTPVVRKTIAQQYNNIRTMDMRVGEILDQLENDGLADNTIVIWTTDHGDGMPRAKRELNDSSLKVPMTIYWPEKWRPDHIKPGTVDEQLISFVDMAPTILAMAGVDAPDHMSGNNFVVEGGAGREYIFAAKDRMDEAEDRVRAVRDTRFKYLRNYRTDVPAGQHIAFRDGLEMMDDLWRMRERNTLSTAQNLWFELRPEEQLFDTLADPDELTDLAANPEYREELIRLRRQLLDWQTRVDDYATTPEIRLAEQYWPGGEQPETPEPGFTMENGKLKLTCDHSASIGYRLDDGAWQLYVTPLKLEPGTTVVAKAVRYGWAESEEVEIEL